MKLVFLFLALPLCSAAQSQSSFEKAMNDFKRLYNANNTDSLCRLFHPDWNKTIPEGCIWKVHLASGNSLEQYGKIKAARYSADAPVHKGSQAAVFDVLFEHERRGQIVFSLKNGKFSSFSINVRVPDQHTKKAE